MIEWYPGYERGQRFTCASDDEPESIRTVSPEVQPEKLFKKYQPTPQLRSQNVCKHKDGTYTSNSDQREKCRSCGLTRKVGGTWAVVGRGKGRFGKRK